MGGHGKAHDIPDISTSASEAFLEDSTEPVAIPSKGILCGRHPIVDQGFVSSIPLVEPVQTSTFRWRPIVVNPATIMRKRSDRCWVFLDQVVAGVENVDTHAPRPLHNIVHLPFEDKK